MLNFNTIYIIKQLTDTQYFMHHIFIQRNIVALTP